MLRPEVARHARHDHTPLCCQHLQAPRVLQPSYASQSRIVVALAAGKPDAIQTSATTSEAPPTARPICTPVAGVHNSGGSEALEPHKPFGMVLFSAYVLGAVSSLAGTIDSQNFAP